jgi:capsular exopolysaccharide synthesis family protein
MKQVDTIEEVELDRNKFKEVFFRYLSYWKWFILSVFTCVSAGFLLHRYQVPQFIASASVLFRDDQSGSGILADELAAFEDLGVINKKHNLENEIQILHSRSLVSRVVRDLDLNVNYYTFGRPIFHQKYEDAPMTLNRISDESETAFFGTWIVEPVSVDRYSLRRNEASNKMGEFAFGDTVRIKDNAAWVLNKTGFFSLSLLNKPYRISVLPIEAAANYYLGAMKIQTVGKSSSVISITVKDAVPQKAIDFINNLIVQHNEDAITDKNMISKNTSDFIAERIDYITNELDDVEGEVENYKQNRKLTDLNSEAKSYLEQSNTIEAEIVKIGSELKLLTMLEEEFKEKYQKDEVVPNNLGFQAEALNDQINAFNKLILEKQKLQYYSGERNPVIIGLNQEIASARSALLNTLKRVKSTYQIKYNELAEQSNKVIDRISKVPEFERQYRNIYRQQQIKEELYLYLLQKREESNLAQAITVANAKIIDDAYSTGSPVNPGRRIYIIFSIIAGFILPFIVINIYSLFDTKVHDKSDVDFLKLPFLGEIPLASEEKQIFVTDKDRGSVAEAFRMLRTNVEFICEGQKNKAKLIFITSTISKEGKSFISINLASSFGLLGKKVLLLGTDLRHPKIADYLNLAAPNKGLINLMTDDTIHFDDVILHKEKSGFPFDILLSGPIPPNPSEILMRKSVGDVFERLKDQYDYIIADTAPVGIVADTLLISHLADATLFVVRAGYLDKRALKILDSMNKDKRFVNLALVLNGQDYSKSRSYGYGYGYGLGYHYHYGYNAYMYLEEEKSFSFKKYLITMKSWFKRKEKGANK